MELWGIKRDKEGHYLHYKLSDSRPKLCVKPHLPVHLLPHQYNPADTSVQPLFPTPTLLDLKKKIKKKQQLHLNSNGREKYFSISHSIICPYHSFTPREGPVTFC